MTEPHEWYPGLFAAFAIHTLQFLSFSLSLYLSLLLLLLVAHLLAEGMREVCFFYVVVWRQRQEYLASGVSIRIKHEARKKERVCSLSKTYKILALSHWTRCRFRSS